MCIIVGVLICTSTLPPNASKLGVKRTCVVAFYRNLKTRSAVILDHALVRDPSSKPWHPPKHKVSTSKGIKFSYLSLISI
jgi:hypothetical protein